MPLNETDSHSSEDKKIKQYDKVSQTLNMRDLGLFPKELTNETIKTKEEKFKSDILKNLLYISHPSISNLKCSINLRYFLISILEETDLEKIKNKKILYDMFDTIINKILTLAYFNHEQIHKNYKKFIITFENVAAIKLLNIIFKGKENHALYQLYTKWINGSEWMLKY